MIMNQLERLKKMKKKIFNGNDHVRDKILDEIKDIIGIEKFDNTKILIETDDKLPFNITLKNVLTLITCVIKDDGKFYCKYF